ncbi:heavy-metal-associated domain-containing protein [Nodosilinea sp. LEGE 07088]|nr:heavy-metal-associated domain-containing protein [Nodosilinea sp. LEGE 07088]
MKTSYLKLDGLMCDGCSEIIERATQKLPGVRRCQVNLDLERAEIEYDPQLMSLETIQKALKGVGYSAEPINETNHLTE